MGMPAGTGREFWRGVIGAGGFTAIPRWTRDPVPGIAEHVIVQPLLVLQRRHPVGQRHQTVRQRRGDREQLALHRLQVALRNLPRLGHLVIQHADDLHPGHAAIMPPAGAMRQVIHRFSRAHVSLDTMSQMIHIRITNNGERHDPDHHNPDQRRLHPEGKT